MSNPTSGPMIYDFGGAETPAPPGGPELLGGKGHGLVAMSRAGLPVPPGFVIAIPCCRYFHENGGRWPEGLAEDVRRHLARLEQRVGRRFGEGAEPLLVSVRSGAAHSMPGMMDTILNCGLHEGLAAQMPDPARFWRVYEAFVRQFGRTVADLPEEKFDAAAAGAHGRGADGSAATRACMALYEAETGRPFPRTPWDALRECIEAVFHSWNNERAIVYRRAHGLEHLEGTAVTVQSMFDSEVSGIAFTANPSAPSANEMVIESSYGLGESIVSGDVAPDRFILDAVTHAIKTRAIGRKDRAMVGLGRPSGEDAFDPLAPSLTDAQIAELADIAAGVERFFGHPVDIEWGIHRGRFALLQARAIRGLDVARDVEKGRLEEIERLRALSAGGHKVWVVHNLSETLEAPTPLTWDILRGFMTGEGGFGRMYQLLGYRPSRAVRAQGVLEWLCGRIYADVDRAAELVWEGWPLAYDHERIIADPRLLETAPTKFESGRTDEKFLLRLPATLWAMARSARLTRRIRRAAKERFEREALPPYLRFLDECKQKDLAALEPSALLAWLDELCRRVLDEFGPESLLPGFLGGVARGELEALLVQLLGPAEGAQWTGVLCSGLEDTTVLQNRMLYEVAQGAATLEQFLEAYGHRAVGEMELSRPRWSEEASYIEQMIAAQRRVPADQSPAAMHARNERRREEAQAGLPATLAAAGGGFLVPQVQDLVRECLALLPYRETGKHYLLMGYAQIRRTLVELGRRWKIFDDVFYLRREELPRFETERGRLQPLIAARKVRRQAFRRLDLPDVIDSRELDRLGLPRERTAAGAFDAVSLSPGCVTGAARLVRDPSEAGELPEDCVLVCASTDPAWTALFTVIRGLIVERGGVLSHGAITARDFGIPAVACPDATRRIPDGARVQVDGDRGRVTLIQD